MTDDNHWHLDKKVPISIILAVVVQSVAALWAFAEMKKDVEVLKSSQATAVMTQKDRDERQDRAAADAVSLVRSDIQELSRKLDRLFERPAR